MLQNLFKLDSNFDMFFLAYSNLLIHYNSSSSKIGSLNPGKYEIECFGGQGGTPKYKIGLPSFQGGYGAYARAQFKVTNKMDYMIQAGMQGFLTSGGLPDGGNASEDGYCGGGGSSRAILNKTLMIVAAGGSGSIFLYDGAPGGGNNTYFWKEPNKNVFEERSDPSYLTETNHGGNAVNGSGGGAGYRGGKGGENSDNITSIGISGTSFISPSSSFTFTEIINGKNKPNYGDGYVTITYDYLCISNCIDCDNGSSCNKCDSSHVKYKNKCEYQSCPNSTFQVGTECFDCRSNCEKCRNSTTCTRCEQGFFMKGNECVSSCGIGYYSDTENRVCTACTVSHCSNCLSNPSTCDACNNPFVLFDNKCADTECPTHYYNNSFICHECSENCLNCTSKYKCTACRSTSFRINKKGNCTLINTASYKDFFDVQTFSRRIQKNRNI